MNAEERSNYIKLGHTGPGWSKLITELNDKLSALDPNYTVEQIKEKFGGLRYYFSTDSNYGQEMLELEEEYELKSYEICELCGSEEDIAVEGSWWKTLCKNCRKDK